MPRKPVSLRRILKPPGKRITVPLRIPPVPAKQWLASGKMTQRTKAIVDFASHFSGSPVSIARRVVAQLSLFQAVELGSKALPRYYAKRTADEIIRSRKIVVATEKFREKKFQVEGCIDLCNALVSVLRAKRIPSLFVREMNHSVVHFFNGKEWFRADPLMGTVGEIGKSKMAWIKKQKLKPKEQRRYAEGLDSADIGIVSLKDFYKYSF